MCQNTFKKYGAEKKLNLRPWQTLRAWETTYHFRSKVDKMVVA